MQVTTEGGVERYTAGMGETVEAPSPKSRPVLSAVAGIAIGVITALAMIALHAAGGAGIGGAMIALGVLGLARTKRFRWWQIVLIAHAAAMAATVVFCVVFVGIALIRSK